MNNIDRITITTLIVVTFIMLIILIDDVNDRLITNSKQLNITIIKYDSIVKLYTKLQLADSLKSIRLNRSFYLDADSVIIDSKGYFRSKYYKQYKLNK